MIDNILVFIKLAELKSYTKVANMLHTTKSTISRKITLLEEYFNKQLIIRTSRSFALTDNGKYIYNKFKNLPRQFDEAYCHLNQNIINTDSPIKALLPAVTAYGESITPHLDYFHEKYPNIILNLMFSYEKPDMDNYDIAITLHKENIDCKKYNLTFIKTEHIQLYCTPQYAKKIRHSTHIR